MKSSYNNRVYSITNTKTRLNRLIAGSGIISIAAYFALKSLSPEMPLAYSKQMLFAAQMMEKAIAVISEHCDRSGIAIDEIIDPNHTGLIGPEYSDLTTTLGHLEAKRTTTIPDFAALIVHMLDQADVTKGDTIAIGCSASFPALLVAVTAAANAMELHPIMIISIGASSYGATKSNFDLLDMYNVLLNNGLIEIPPAAISLGGEGDIGENFDEHTKRRILQKIQQNNIPLILEPDLQKNGSERMKVYAGNSSIKRIAAFINIGGSYANLGVNEYALNLKPGLNEGITVTKETGQGVIFEMAAMGIPIIHLLFIKGLAFQYDLPWDPTPLPDPGSSQLTIKKTSTGYFWLLTIVYFSTLIILIVLYKSKVFKHWE